MSYIPKGPVPKKPPVSVDKINKYAYVMTDEERDRKMIAKEMKGLSMDRQASPQVRATAAIAFALLTK